MQQPLKTLCSAFIGLSALARQNGVRGNAFRDGNPFRGGNVFRLGNASRQENALAHYIDLAYKYVAVNQDHLRPKSLHHSSHKTSCHTSHRYPADNC